MIAVDDVEGVVLPVGVDVVFFEGGGQDFLARVFHADAEGFEDFDAGGGAGTAARGWLFFLLLLLRWLCLLVLVSARTSSPRGARCRGRIDVVAVDI